MLDTTETPTASEAEPGPVALSPDVPAVVLLRPPGDLKDWHRSCRYCHADLGSPQGRAGHERQCAFRSTVPPLGPGRWEITITGSRESRYQWEVRRPETGELLADSIGRTWGERSACEADVESFLRGPYEAPPPGGETDEARLARLRRQRKQERKLSGKAPTVRRSTAPGPLVKRSGGKAADDPTAILDALDGLLGGRAFPASAMLDVARWVEQTRELLDKAQ